MLRCLVCGCSRLDPQGYKCALCGGAPGVRSEQCYITEDTKAKLLAHAEELKTFGITLEEYEPIQKRAGEVVGYLAFALAVVESLNAGILHKLVLYLREIEIHKDEVLRLRLGKPEEISGILDVTTGWSDWRPFPDPRRGGVLTAPFGAGCYELRHCDGRLVLFGTSKNVVYRMTSLLSKPLGAGTRNNNVKRAYVLEHLEDIEYRTTAIATSQEAKECERVLKSGGKYILPT
jgi:hypothetical protein